MARRRADRCLPVVRVTERQEEAIRSGLPDYSPMARAILLAAVGRIDMVDEALQPWARTRAGGGELGPMVIAAVRDVARAAEDALGCLILPCDVGIRVTVQSTAMLWVVEVGDYRASGSDVITALEALARSIGRANAKKAPTHPEG